MYVWMCSVRGMMMMVSRVSERWWRLGGGGGRADYKNGIMDFFNSQCIFLLRRKSTWKDIFYTYTYTHVYVYTHTYIYIMAKKPRKGCIRRCWVQIYISHFMNILEFICALCQFFFCNLLSRLLMREHRTQLYLSVWIHACYIFMK